MGVVVAAVCGVLKLLIVSILLLAGLGMTFFFIYIQRYDIDEVKEWLDWRKIGKEDKKNEKNNKKNYFNY